MAVSPLTPAVFRLRLCLFVVDLVCFPSLDRGTLLKPFVVVLVGDLTDAHQAVQQRILVGPSPAEHVPCSLARTFSAQCIRLRDVVRSGSRHICLRPLLLRASGNCTD
jgi:hypothetical protein